MSDEPDQQASDDSVDTAAPDDQSYYIEIMSNGTVNQYLLTQDIPQIWLQWLHDAECQYVNSVHYIYEHRDLKYHLFVSQLSPITSVPV